MRREPDDPMVRARTERGLDRLVNFTDATVAIAITVLVLPLVDLASEIQTEPMRVLVDDNLSSIMGFTITFFVIARLWVVHHRVFETVADYDGGLIWWSILWLFSIVTLPFAANILSGLENWDDSAVFAFYIGTILAATLTMVGTEVHLRRHPELLRDDAPTIDITLGATMALLTFVALVLAVTVPAINLWALLLLALSGPVHGAINRFGPSGQRPDPP